MASLFVIQEMRATGGPPQENPDGERFEWTAKRRSIPKRPIELPWEMRKVRTDYGGAKEPSVQLLGRARGPTTIEGRWDDRYNYDGFAKAERDRFQSMADRGNPVRVSFDADAYICIVEKFVPRYHRRDYIEYSITLDNYGEPTAEANASPTTVSTPLQDLDDASFITQAALQTHADGPITAFVSGLDTTISQALGSASQHLDEISAAIDARQGALQPITEFAKLATMMRIVQGDASNVLTSLVGVRADVELGVRNAISTLDFECWSRGLRGQMRLLKGKTIESSSGLEERSDAKAVGFYRPRAGESLYRVSAQVYGTPHAWKPIYERNGLRSMRLTGDELLIIPERSAA